MALKWLPGVSQSTLDRVTPLCELLPPTDLDIFSFACALRVSDTIHLANPTLFRTYDVSQNQGDNCAI